MACTSVSLKTDSHTDSSCPFISASLIWNEQGHSDGEARPGPRPPDEGERPPAGHARSQHSGAWSGLTRTNKGSRLWTVGGGVSQGRTRGLDPGGLRGLWGSMAWAADTLFPGFIGGDVSRMCRDEAEESGAAGRARAARMDSGHWAEVAAPHARGPGPGQRSEAQGRAPSLLVGQRPPFTPGLVLVPGCASRVAA